MGVDTEAELFWTTEIQLSAKDGFGVNEKHFSVQAVKKGTERALCTSAGRGVPLGYWDVEGRPAMLRGRGHAPFALHHAGPAKATLGKRCSVAYLMSFIGANDRWFLNDLDAGRVVMLNASSLGGLYHYLLMG